jgi:hypothetical protein
VSGLPARGYRWKDAAAGNVLARRHGAHSDRMVEPVAAGHLANLAFGTLADALDVLNADAARSWARCAARRDLVAGWLADHGGDLEDGNVRGAAVYLDRLESRAASLRAELRTAIEAVQARTEAGPAMLDALRAEGRALLAAQTGAGTLEDGDRDDGTPGMDEWVQGRTEGGAGVD